MKARAEAASAADPPRRDGPPRHGGPRPVLDADAAALHAILRVEREARGVATLGELAFLIANETRRLVGARQVFVFERSDRAGYTARAVSSLATVERDSPLIQWLERLVGRVDAEPGEPAPRLLSLRDTPAHDDVAATYPFPHAAWMPLRWRGGAAIAGLLLTREAPWDEPALAVATHLADTYAHAWRALAPSRRLWPTIGLGRRKAWIAGGAALAALAPVPLSALAPAEVVPNNPFVMAAPIDGVIAAVEVEPNTEVKAGQVLIRFNDTSLRDQLEIAERTVAVAGAKWKQFAQGAFVDPGAKRELSVSEAEYQLKKAERDYAADLLARGVIVAPKDGIAVFNDKRDLVGRPVSTGQRLMEIADPRDVQVRINVAVDDSALLREGAAARVFLDTDPLRPAAATIARASHAARLIEGGQLVFRADARLSDADREPARLGVRGTAQIYGDRMPLIFLLLRRPISYLRQHYGW